MTNAPDISKDAVERTANEADICRKALKRSPLVSSVLRDNAATLRAQAARIAELEAEAATVREKVERAYGLLWMVLGDDKKVHDARRILLDQIDRDGQRRGIAFAKTQYETPDIMSVLHKLP